MNGLTQGIAGVLLIQLWPEEAKEGIASVWTGGACRCEKGQQRQTLGLCENVAELPAFRVAKVDGAEELKSNHVFGGQ